MKQHVDYCRKDILTSRKRHLDYLDELYTQYKSRDKEIDRLAITLSGAYKEKEFLQIRRDEAFNTLIELMAERRRILGLV